MLAHRALSQLASICIDTTLELASSTASCQITLGNSGKLTSACGFKHGNEAPPADAPTLEFETAGDSGSSCRLYVDSGSVPVLVSNCPWGPVGIKT